MSAQVEAGERGGALDRIAAALSPRALAAAARDSYRKLPARAKQAAEIDGWLAARGK